MLTKITVQHIAHLARLEISNKELSQYAHELTRIVDYVDQLKAVETAGVEPTAQITGLINVTRPDKAAPWPADEVRQALDQAGIKPGVMLKVPKIL